MKGETRADLSRGRLEKTSDRARRSRKKVNRNESRAILEGSITIGMGATEFPFFRDSRDPFTHRFSISLSASPTPTTRPTGHYQSRNRRGNGQRKEHEGGKVSLITIRLALSLGLSDLVQCGNMRRRTLEGPQFYHLSFSFIVFLKTQQPGNIVFCFVGSKVGNNVVCMTRSETGPSLPQLLDSDLISLPIMSFDPASQIVTVTFVLPTETIHNLAFLTCLPATQTHFPFTESLFYEVSQLVLITEFVVILSLRSGNFYFKRQVGTNS